MILICLCCLHVLHVMVVALRAAFECWYEREKNKETRQSRVVYFGRDTRRERALSMAIANVLHADSYRVCKTPKFHEFLTASAIAGYC